MSNSLQSHRLWPARRLCPWDSPGKNTGVGSHFLLQGLSAAQGWTHSARTSSLALAGGFPFPPPGALPSSGMDPHLPHLFSGVGRWVPISSSRGSPQLRDGPTPPAPLLWRWQVGSHFLLQGLSAAQGWSHTARTSSLAGGFFSTRASGEQTFVKKTEKEKHWLPELKCSKSPRVTVTVFNEETDPWK